MRKAPLMYVTLYFIIESLQVEKYLHKNMSIKYLPSLQVKKYILFILLSDDNCFTYIYYLDL